MAKEVTLLRRIEIKNPTLLAGWPGMGNVALGCVDYLRKKLRATAFAEIDLSQFSAPEAVVVENGIARLPEIPSSMFYYVKDHNLIIFESDTQVGGRLAKHLMNLILDFVQQFNIRRIYTGAAFPIPMSHRELPQVYGVSNVKPLRDLLVNYRIKIMEEGQISGSNGLLLGYAEQREIEAACLLATMPQYAIHFPYPKASKALIEALQKILNFRTDTLELDLAIREMDERMDSFEEKIKEMFPSMYEQVETEELEKEKIPASIMEKIEKLFQEAKLDKQKAYQLKEELDRWNLYELYEDRFLDLFKDGQ